MKYKALYQCLICKQITEQEIDYNPKNETLQGKLGNLYNMQHFFSFPKYCSQIDHIGLSHFIGIRFEEEKKLKRENE